MHIFDLPYDIRYQIYLHLFPRNEQIYIATFHRALMVIIPGSKVPIELLLTSRATYAEASEYLYNSYLFNIIGTKRDCLANYGSFLSTLKKHARNQVHVHAFSNGSHSATMCLSIGVGMAKLGLLERRERGQRKSLEEIEREVALIPGIQQAAFWTWRPSWITFELLVAVGCAIIAMFSIWLELV